MRKIKVGVFDSGIGAQHVINSIKRKIPDVDIIYKDDKSHMPYGDRTVAQIHDFVRPIFQEFIDEGCRLIVIACNTVTTNLITGLRQEFPVPMVGMEPAVKPAAERTRSGVIAVCATPRTLASKRYAWLKSEYASDVKVLEPDCGDWALMIENNRVERDKVANRIQEVIDLGADEIVLGCTHYHWIEELIKQVAVGRAEVIQPEQPVIRQLRQVLRQLA
jgi:glutamate racemase